MKICDASMIIAICEEIECPSLFYEIAKLGHKLIIPEELLKEEILNKKTCKIIQKFVDEEIIEIVVLDNPKKIVEFREEYEYLGLGESYVFVTYEQYENKGDKVYCIFDDQAARKTASERGNKYKGLIGLLDLLKKRNIMSEQKINDIKTKLYKSNFRCPKNTD